METKKVGFNEETAVIVREAIANLSVALRDSQDAIDALLELFTTLVSPTEGMIRFGELNGKQLYYFQD